jgi:hypothetical protein
LIQEPKTVILPRMAAVEGLLQRLAGTVRVGSERPVARLQGGNGDIERQVLYLRRRLAEVVHHRVIDRNTYGGRAGLLLPHGPATVVCLRTVVLRRHRKV